MILELLLFNVTAYLSSYAVRLISIRPPFNPDAPTRVKTMSFFA